jgi:putative redox protein
LAAAGDWLRREREAPRLLVGHGLGGTAALAAARRIPEMAAVATLAAPFPTHAETVADLHHPLLIFHSPADNAVDIGHAGRIYDAARHPKSFVSLGTADHLLSNERDARYAGEILAAWAERWLEPRLSETGTETVAPVGAPGEVVVTEISGFAQSITAGRHRLSADEPLAVGGTGTGPNPYELLLAGLGACTSMTLRLYAKRKSLPLEGIRVRLHHSKIHALDCATCDTQAGKIDHIERVIEIVGDLTPEQRARLLEIADMCPVHRTLESEIHVSTRYA